MLVDLERTERGNKEKNILVILERKKAFIFRCNIYKQYEHYSRNCQRDIVEQIGQLNSARSSGGVATGLSGDRGLRDIIRGIKGACRGLKGDARGLKGHVSVIDTGRRL